MIYRTQLIYVKEGKESVFDEFEAIAIPIIREYNGELVFRVRPGKDSLIEGTVEVPYEIHLVSFPSQLDCDNFGKDEKRKSFLHMKEQSIREAVLYQGERV